MFFASIGLHLTFAAFMEIPVFLALIIVVAVAGKVVGTGIRAAIVGLNTRDALAVGVGMSGRGAVELVVADVALRAGLFSAPAPTPTGRRQPVLRRRHHGHRHNALNASRPKMDRVARWFAVTMTAAANRDYSKRRCPGRTTLPGNETESFVTIS